jgi:hypothetical protein
VELNNYLGVYISKDTATVVCVDSQSKGGDVVGCFSIRVEEPSEATPHVLAGLISQGCSEREWAFGDVSVALDCAMFMQHNVHSDFSDAKQIGATVRFDAEEALATDISDIAVAFQIVSSDESGSNLTVFTAKKNTLSDLLLSLQSGGMDPVGIEPDVNCLSRYISRKIPACEGGREMFGVLSAKRGYLMAPHQNGDNSGKAARVRTFLVGSTKDRGGLLVREAIMTTALTEQTEPISRLRIFDSIGAADSQVIGERLGMEADSIQLIDPAEAENQPLEDIDPVDFAIAYGAAVACADKTPAVSFRDDFMPYQGKKLKLEKALKFFSISVTVLLVAVGLYFQTRLFSVNGYRAKVREKFARDYAVAKSNTKLPSDMSIKGAVDSLTKEWRGLLKVAQGVGDETAPSKLATVFDAFNKIGAQTKLNITKVQVGSRSITISGWTSSRANTNRFFATVKQCGMDIVRENVVIEDGKDKFSIVIGLKAKK